MTKDVSPQDSIVRQKHAESDIAKAEACAKKFPFYNDQQLARQAYLAACADVRGELMPLLDEAQIALQHYCSDTMRIGSTITPTWADAALKKIRAALEKKESR